VDLTWRSNVGEEFWLTSESNVTDVPMLNGKPDTARMTQRSRIIRRLRIRILGVDDAGHPTSLRFFVEKHTHEDLMAETSDGTAVLWSAVPNPGQPKWPPEQATFSVSWDGKEGRWVPTSDEDKVLFARATRDISSLLESRWLREEIPDTKVALGGTWNPVDPGRKKLAREMLGDSAGYSLDVTLNAATDTIEDTAFFVLKGNRRLSGNLPGTGGSAPRGMSINTVSDVRVSSSEVFRVLAETTGVVDLPDLGSGSGAGSIRRTIDTSERIEPNRQ
jgi:hypothetical protein